MTKREEMKKKRNMKEQTQEKMSLEALKELYRELILQRINNEAPVDSLIQIIFQETFRHYRSYKVMSRLALMGSLVLLYSNQSEVHRTFLEMIKDHSLEDSIKETLNVVKRKFYAKSVTPLEKKIRQVAMAFFLSRGENIDQVIRRECFDLRKDEEIIATALEFFRITHIAMLKFRELGLHHGLLISTEQFTEEFRDSLLSYLPINGSYQDINITSVLSWFPIHDFFKFEQFSYEDYEYRVIGLNLGDDEKEKGYSVFMQSFSFEKHPNLQEIIDLASEHFIVSYQNVRDVASQLERPRNEELIEYLLQLQFLQYIGHANHISSVVKPRIFMGDHLTPSDFTLLFSLLKETYFWDILGTKSYFILRVWDDREYLDVLTKPLPFRILEVEAKPKPPKVILPPLIEYKKSHDFEIINVSAIGRTLFPRSLDLLQGQEKKKKRKLKGVGYERENPRKLDVFFHNLTVSFFPPDVKENIQILGVRKRDLKAVLPFVKFFYPEGCTLRPFKVLIRLKSEKLVEKLEGFDFSKFENKYVTSFFDWTTYKSEGYGDEIWIMETDRFPLSIPHLGFLVYHLEEEVKRKIS